MGMLPSVRQMRRGAGDIVSIWCPALSEGLQQQDQRDEHGEEREITGLETQEERTRHAKTAARVFGKRDQRGKRGDGSAQPPISTPRSRPTQSVVHGASRTALGTLLTT